jgi:hypothetical protein
MIGILTLLMKYLKLTNIQGLNAKWINRNKE